MKNRILIAIFIALLIVPNALKVCLEGYISTESTENRALAARPELSLSSIDTYPEQYEEYYNDHLAFKSQIVHLKAKLEYKIFHIVESEKVMLGKENWLFYKSACVPELDDEKPIEDYRGTNVYSEAEMQVIADNINTTDSYLKSRDIAFSVMICPNKENMYEEYLPDSVIKVNEDSKIETLIGYLNENTEAPVIWPYDDLTQEKTNYQLYYRYDTHWNELAGFIASQNIREIYCGEKESLENYEVEGVQGAAPTDLAYMINLPEEFTDDMYWHVTNYKPEVTAELQEASEDNFYKNYVSNAEDQRRVLVIRDSYGEAMMNYLPKDFSNVIFVHRNVFNVNYLDVYQPDIVIYEVVERATNDMMDMKTIMGIQ